MLKIQQKIFKWGKFMKKRIFSYLLTILFIILAVVSFRQKEILDEEIKIGVLTSTILAPKSYLLVYNQDLQPIEQKKISEGGVGTNVDTHSRVGDELFLNIAGTKYLDFHINGMLSVNCATNKITKYPVSFSNQGRRVGTEAVAANSKNIYTIERLVPAEVIMHQRSTEQKTARWMPDNHFFEFLSFIAANEQYVFVGTSMPSGQTTGQGTAYLYILDASTLAVHSKINLSTYGDRVGDSYLLTEESLYFEVSEEKPLSQKEIKDLREQYEWLANQETEPNWLVQKDSATEVRAQETPGQDKINIPLTYSYYRLVRVDLHHFYKEIIDIGSKGIGGIEEYGDLLLILSDHSIADYLMVYDKGEKQKLNYELPDSPHNICVSGDRGYLLGHANEGFYLSEINLASKPFHITKRQKLEIDYDQHSVGMYVYTK